MANLLSQVPKSAQPFVATLVRTIYQQTEPADVWSRHGQVIEQLEARFPEAATMVADAGPDILAFTAFPQSHWRQIWSNNPQERLNKEIRRRTDVVGIFPNRKAVIRLVDAVLAEQNDEWLIARRYLSDESMKPLMTRRSSPPQEAAIAESLPLAV
jgi:transposase-like protein